MGLRLDVAASDADLEAWRRVRRAVLPDELAVSVEVRGGLPLADQAGRPERVQRSRTVGPVSG
jgi:hypothetical protein